MKKQVIKAMHNRRDAAVKFAMYMQAILSNKEYNEELQQLPLYTFFFGKSQTKNAKTGKIPNIYGCKNSCPITNCPFKNCGCYARQGHCNLWFDIAGGKAYRAAKQTEAKQLNISLQELKNRLQELPAGIMARHNISGDIAKINSNDINAVLLLQLIDAYDGLHGYTYTHCTGNTRNYKLLKAAADCGFTVNKSTEKEIEAIDAKKHGVPAVLAVEKANNPIVKKDGVLFVQCPAQKSSGLIDCKKCGACANKNRAAVIVFEAHGAENIVKKIKAAGILQKEI